DYITTEAMLRYFITRVIGRISIVKPEVMICVPAGVTGVEQRAVQDAAEAAGARRPANIIPEPLAAAIGARIPVNIPQGHMIVDIGGGRTEAAIISMYGIVVTESVRVAGDRLDDAIANHVKRRHNIIIGDRTPPELASDVVDRGIVMAGGTSLLRNLDRLITQEIGISCYVADNPLECVAMGAGIALDHLDLIKRSMPAEGEWLVSF